MPQLVIDLGGTAVKLGVAEADVILAEESFPSADGAVGLEQVRSTAERLLRGEHPDAVAIAVPGIVDPGRRRLLAAHDKYELLHGVDLADWSQRTFGAKAVVENDARAALVGEMASGVAAGARDAVLIALGTGIGTAAAVDGRVLRGAHGHAGILSGHVTVDIDARRCPCGNVGCAEALASTWALRASIEEGDLAIGEELARRCAAKEAFGIADLVETVDEPESAAILAGYVRIWGAVLVGQCHAYDPTVVVVTGGVMRARGRVLPALVEYVHGHLWSSANRPALVAPERPEHSVLRGLARLALDIRNSGEPD